MKLIARTGLLLVTFSIILFSCEIKWEIPINDRDPYEKYNKSFIGKISYTVF